MLHILLLILKIVGIILAVILGIIILLLGIILFVPIRYEITSKCDGTIDSLKAKVKAVWLFHLLRADVLVKGKKLKWQMRAAWIKKSSAMVFGEQKDEKESEAKEKESGKESRKDSKEMEEKPDESEEVKEITEIHDQKHEEESKADETISEESRKKSVSDKIKEKYEKIKKSVNDLLEKKEKISNFLTDQVHIRAFKKLKKALIVLLKRLKPKRIDINLIFGFEDPGITGKVLAGLAVLYPFMGDTTRIEPDFSEKVLKGKIYLKGRIRICHFVWLALKLLLSKDVRKSYKDIRNFKL